MSKSFDTICRILLTQFAVVRMKSRLQFITDFIIQINWMKGRHSWNNSNIYLYVLVISRTRIRVKLYSIVGWMSKKHLAQNRHKIWSSSNCNWTEIQNDLVRKRASTIWPNYLFDWVFVYKLSGSGLESSRSHFNFNVLDQASIKKVIPKSQNCSWHFFK